MRDPRKSLLHTIAILTHLTEHWLTLATAPDMSEIQGHLEGTLYKLTSLVAPDLVRHMAVESGTPPYFALSWILTWWAHEDLSWNALMLLWDFIIITGAPEAPTYIAAALLATAADDLLALPPDFPTLHTTTAALPKSLPESQWSSHVLPTAAALLIAAPPPSGISPDAVPHLEVLAQAAPFPPISVESNYSWWKVRALSAGLSVLGAIVLVYS